MALFDGSRVESGYQKAMTEKTQDYSIYIRQAERIFKERGGKPSLDEAECYNKAAKKCEEIMQLNLSGRNVHDTWRRRRDDCEKRVKEIADALTYGGGSKNDSLEIMEKKVQEYGNYIREAERILTENGGKPSREEAEAYNRAALKCEELMQLNASNRSAYEQWLQRRNDCGKRIQDIADALTAKSSHTDSDKDSHKDFQTGNANADVTVEMIQSWYKGEPAQGFESIVGMESVKKRLMEEASGANLPNVDAAMGISPVQSYFLYGPPGTGKTTFINAFVKELMSREDSQYKYISLTGAEIHNSLVGVAEKIVTAAFAEAIDNAPCIIFLDEVEGVCANRSDSKVASHEKRLTNAFLEARNRMNQSGKKVIFFGATNHPSDVDPAMLDSVKLVYIPLPDEKARANFFRKRFGKVLPEEGFSYEDMAGATENCSFRELNMLCDSCVSSLKSALVEAYRNSGGEEDDARMDAWIMDKLETGEVRLERALFEEKLREYPPKDKTAVLEEFRGFEGKLSSLG